MIGRKQEKVVEKFSTIMFSENAWAQGNTVPVETFVATTWE